MLSRALDVDFELVESKDIEDTHGELRRRLQCALRALPGVTWAVVGVVDGTLLVQTTGGDVEEVSAVVQQHKPAGIEVDLRATQSAGLRSQIG